MKQVPIKLGPLALLLTVISICLAVLAILCVTTSRADLRLAEKYAQTVRIRYELEAQGQAYLREMDELSPTDLADVARQRADDDGVIWSSFEQDGSRLRVGLRLEGDQLKVVAWRQEKEWTQQERVENLWTGFGF